MQKNCQQEVLDIRRSPKLKFREFCDALKAALDRHHPGWAGHFGDSDLRRWVGQRWPVPPTASLNIRIWATSCYRQLAANETHRLAG
jgi:hypothetical protein